MSETLQAMFKNIITKIIPQIEKDSDLHELHTLYLMFR